MDGMDGDLLLPISHQVPICTLSQSLKSLERRSRGRVATFSIQAREQRLYEEMMRTEVVREAQGLYFVQTLPDRLGEQC